MAKYITGLFTLTLAFCFFIGNVPKVLAAAAEEEFTLEEITVTAEKRTEDLQKVSISMSVLLGEEIRSTGRTTIADIIKDMPNIGITDSGTSGGLKINIRGLGSDLPSGESSVSTNFDGAADARGESTLFGYFDIDRIEVLRGPQGTLYGRNAIGGVLNVVSVKPSADELEGYVAFEVGNYDKKRVEAALNVPITDKFAGRLASVHTQQVSYTKDDHGYRNDQSGLAARLQLRYQPTADAYINLLYNYTEQSGQSWSDIVKANWLAGIYDINRNVYPYHLTSKNKRKNTKLSLTAEFQLGPGIVTVIPTYQTFTGFSSAYSLGMGSTTPTFNVSERPYDYVAKIGELRYANKSDSNIKWTFGLYYSSTDDPLSPEEGRGASYKTSSDAVFAQVAYPFSDTLRVIVGGRYDVDKKGYYDAINYLHESDTVSFKYFDYKLGIEKDYAEGMMGYFTLASGHKPGGFSSMGSSGIPYEMESNVSGELGVKSRFLENRLQVNGDVFYYIYKGYQAVEGVWVDDPSYPSGGYVDVRFHNADEAMSLGGEIETTALIANATELTLNLSYLKNEYTKDFFTHATIHDPRINLKGKPMAHSPKFTFKAAIDHTFVFSDGSMLKPRVSYRWSDWQYLGFVAQPDYYYPAYSIVDFTMMYSSTKSWYLNFYADNALNEHYYVNTQSQAGFLTVFPGSPRVIGLKLNISF